MMFKVGCYETEIDKKIFYWKNLKLIIIYYIMITINDNINKWVI
jgi:hypothetical protein